MPDKVAQKEETASGHYAKALEYLKSKDLDRAAFEFRLSLERDPSFIQAHFALASLYLRNDDLKTSEFHINQILELKPDWNEARFLKGKILFQKEEYRQAIEYLDALQANATGNNGKRLLAEILLLKGLALQHTGDMEAAQNSLLRVLDNDPSNALALEAMEYQKIFASFRQSDNVQFRVIAQAKMITRSEWAWLLTEEIIEKRDGRFKNLGLDTNNQRQHSLPNDVPEHDPAAIQIMKALLYNLTFTFPDGTFLPGQNLRRAEIAITFTNLFDTLHPDAINTLPVKSSRFNDLPEWHPLQNSVIAAVDRGLLVPDTYGNIRINEPVSGREALLAVYILREMVK